MFCVSHKRCYKCYISYQWPNIL